MILQDISDLSPFANLDQMYMQIPRHAIDGDHDEKTTNQLKKRFRQTVGSIIVAFDVLSVSALESLLSIENFDMNLALNPLHSVLNISKNRENLIRLLHLSFRDFLLAKERCRDVSFWIDQKVTHLNLVKTCLQLLFKVLKRNICNLESSDLGAKIPTDQVNFYLPKSFQYACCYWITHLEQLDPEYRNEIGLHDNGHIHSFFQKHFLHWLETLIFIGRLQEGKRMIMRLQSLFNVSEFFGLYLPSRIL